INSVMMRRVPPGRTPRERDRYQREMFDAYRRADEEFRAEELKASATNWRPLVSYTANITRVGEQMLGTNACWYTLSALWPPGQLFPSQGTVSVLGQSAWNNTSLNHFVGLCPEQDAFYEWMTGWDFVHTCARLSGMTRADARDAAARTIEAVGMTYAKDRAIR